MANVARLGLVDRELKFYTVKLKLFLHTRLSLILINAEGTIYLYSKLNYFKCKQFINFHTGRKDG